MEYRLFTIVRYNYSYRDYNYNRVRNEGVRVDISPFTIVLSQSPFCLSSDLSKLSLLS
jgi:hypothetical protein